MNRTRHQHGCICNELEHVASKLPKYKPLCLGCLWVGGCVLIEHVWLAMRSKKRFMTVQTTDERTRRLTDLCAWTVAVQPKRGRGNLSERRKQRRFLRRASLVSHLKFPPSWWRRLGGAVALSAGFFTGIWAQSTPGTHPAVAQVSTCVETSGPMAELGPAPWETLTFPALPPLPTLDPLYEEIFKNGLHVLILEDHQVPLVNGFLLSEVGSWLDPPEKLGLADMAADLLREGGSIAYSATDLDEFLANRAASIETSSGIKSFQITFQSEPSDLESVLRAMASLVRAPLFPATKLELVKQRQHASIARRNDEPGLVLRRAFSKLIYGKDSPFAREPTDETIDHVQREDLVRFHAENFGPDSNTFLVLYGDLDQRDARRIAADTFGDWPRLFNSERPTLPPVPDSNPEASFVLLADKPGLTQAQVVLGEIGGTFRDSLYASLDVINALLNGLGGRLFDELRSRQGLAYSVYGVWSPKYNYPGVFMAGGETETTQVPALIDGIETELRRLDNEPVSSDELAYAKDFVLNSMIFELAPNKSEMLRRLVLYRFHGYPDDFLVQLRSAIEQVNALSIQRAARERIRDESFVTLVLGDRAKLEPILRSHFGRDRVHLYPLDK